MIETAITFSRCYFYCPLLKALVVDFTNQYICFLPVLPTPHFFGTVLGEVFDSASMDHVGSMEAAFLMYWFLQNMR